MSYFELNKKKSFENFTKNGTEMDGNKDPVYVPSTLSPMQRSGVSDSYLMVSCTCKSRGTGGAYWLIGLIKADTVASKNLKLSSAKSFIIFLYGNRLDDKEHLDPYSPTILKNILCLFSTNCKFECNTTPDWLNHLV